MESWAPVWTMRIRLAWMVGRPCRRITAVPCGLRPRPDCFAEDVATWWESHLAERVHVPVFSFDVGLTKPDPAIYRQAMRRLGVTPDAAVFVGDGEDGELVGATRAGLRAFRAEWFLLRWDNRFKSDSGDQALQRPEDVLRVVV